jgi:hypothetical protein
MPLHSGQVKYLRETTRRKTRINVLVPANRWGKSSLVACLQIWYNFYKFGIPEGNTVTWAKAEYRTANIAPQSAQTEAVFKAIHQILTSTYAIKTVDNKLVTNKCYIEWFYLRNRTLNTAPYKQFFFNNSYIEHRSLGADQGDSLQGKPYGLITYDEGGRSLHLKEEVMGNIIPRLGDWVAPFHLLSTPDQNSPSILYHYELYQNGKAGIKSTYTQEGSLKENLLFGQDQIDEQYKLYADDPLGPQVLDGKFIFGGDNIFNIEAIQEAQTTDLDDGKRHIDGHRYIISSDTAIGTDEMVHTVLDITDLKVEKNGEQIVGISGQAELVRQMAVKGNSKSPQAHLNDFIDLYDAYRQEGIPMLYMLETFNGESVRWYHDLPSYIQINTTCYGSWQPDRRTTENTNKVKPKNIGIKKVDILVALSKLLEARAIKIPKNDQNRHHDGALLDQQLSIYKEDDKNIPTDRVISLCLAAWGAIHKAATQQTITFIDM